MKIRSNQLGFSAIEGLLVVLIVGAISAVAYGVYHRSQTHAATTNPVSSQAAASSDSAPTVSKTADLNKAEKTLDQNDPSADNSGDSNQLDSQTNDL